MIVTETDNKWLVKSDMSSRHIANFTINSNCMSTNLHWALTWHWHPAFILSKLIDTLFKQCEKQAKTSLPSQGTN